MDLSRIFLICSWLTLVLTKPLKVFNNVTDLEYYSMPPLFHLDDYDHCLAARTNESLYCYATFQLSPLDPQSPSKIWQIIAEVISLERNYRHDWLRHGICVQKTCPEIAAGEFATGNGTERLWRTLSECYSRRYKEDGLAARVTKLHCETSEPYYAIDALDVIYAVVVLAIVIIVVIGTIYDVFIRCCDQTTSPTKQTTGGRVLEAFSVIKNMERLRSEVTSDDGKALLPIQGVRVVTMFFVVMTHSGMAGLYGPVHNPKYTEDITLRAAKTFLTNGSLICQVFFLISGWLLSYYLCLIFEGKRIKARHLFLAFVNRYLRLLPILLLSIGFGATWLRHAGRGPVWNHVVGNEFDNCRKNGWTNLLFLNNYIDPGHMCLQQTWHLASDSQNFILGLCIMYFVVKRPQLAKKIFAFFIALGMSITFAEVYYNEYDIVFRSYPETFYTWYRELEEWLRIYSPGHHHICCYVQGLACGFFFYKFRKENRDFLTTKFTTALWFVYIWVAPIFTILIAGAFYQEGFETTRFWAAFYQAICRYSFGLPISLALFAFTMGKGGAMRDFCAWAPFQVLGRLSFSVYLTHTASIWIRRGSARLPSYIFDYNSIVEGVGDVCVSYAIGLLVCLLVEMPTSALQKILLTPTSKMELKAKDKVN